MKRNTVHTHTHTQREREREREKERAMTIFIMRTLYEYQFAFNRHCCKRSLESSDSVFFYSPLEVIVVYPKILISFQVQSNCT
jgi:hypothetical protein